jgi:hypothetical protein
VCLRGQTGDGLDSGDLALRYAAIDYTLLALGGPGQAACYGGKMITHAGRPLAALGFISRTNIKCETSSSPCLVPISLMGCRSQLSPVDDPEFGEHVVQVALDCGVRNKQPLGYLVIGQMLTDKRNNPTL